MGIGAYSESITKIGEGVGNFLFNPVKRMFRYAESDGEKSFGGMLSEGFNLSEDEAKQSVLAIPYKKARRNAEGNIIKNAEGKAEYDQKYLSGQAILGTGIAGALGYRFASGGGMYRDKNGNTDIAGMPFI